MSNKFPDRIWKVCKGSGMGLLHSGDLADLAYYNRAERNWATCPVTMKMYGIAKIWSFRDDILVLASERLKTHTYGRGMINRAGYFVTKCEKVSHDKIENLDCRSVDRKRHHPIQALHKTNQFGSSSTRHELPPCTHSQVVASLYGSTPWRPQHVAQLRGESKGHSH